MLARYTPNSASVPGGTNYTKALALKRKFEKSQMRSIFPKTTQPKIEGPRGEKFEKNFSGRTKKEPCSAYARKRERAALWYERGSGHKRSHRNENKPQKHLAWCWSWPTWCGEEHVRNLTCTTEKQGRQNKTPDKMPSQRHPSSAKLLQPICTQKLSTIQNSKHIEMILILPTPS